MRSWFALLVLMAPLPLSQIQCGDGIPVIEEVVFPAEIPGDMTETMGTLTFTDSNAGVTYGYLTVLACDPNFECESYEMDFAADDPGIQDWFAGTIEFGFTCQNYTDYTGYFTYEWRLEDIDGNVSNPYEFSFSCTPAVSAKEAGKSGAVAHIQPTFQTWPHNPR